MAANISNTPDQGYADPGIRIFQGLRPDITLIQEFNYGSNSTADIRSFVDTAFGPEFAYTRETGQIPNGVISRFPILASGRWADPEVGNRGFVWAQIDVPGNADLWVFSVHLLTAGAGTRNAEAISLMGRINTLVPSGALLVLGGDFNTDSRTEACLTTFKPLFKTTGPYPEDQEGDSGTNASRAKPYDWVLTSTTLLSHEIPVVVGSQTFPDGLVVDTRVHKPIEDIAPAQKNDSGVMYMQHMAVVKDYSF